MIKTVIYCDRCKKEFKKWNHKRNELIGICEMVYESYVPYPDVKKDLCESCYIELEKWWKSESEEKEC